MSALLLHICDRTRDLEYKHLQDRIANNKRMQIKTDLIWALVYLEENALPISV